MTEIEALEAVFLSEIGGKPLYEKRIPAKMRRKLIEDGELDPHTHVFGGRFPVEVECVVLTHKGRIRYCEWAAKQPDADDV